MIKHLFIQIILMILPLVSFAEPFKVIIETPNNSIQNDDIVDQSVGFEKLTIDGANNNDVMFFSGEKWIGAPIPGLRFRGSWDPTTNTDPSIDPTKNYYINLEETINAMTGDYFIVNTSLVDGENNILWNKGDWIVFNGQNWERINNTGSVISIFGRKSKVIPMADDYNWAQIDKTNSSIFDLSNIFTSGNSLENNENYVLKWDKEKLHFYLAPDLVGAIEKEATSDQILDGEVKDQDISENANISASKIEGFDSGLGKIPFAGNVEVQNLNLNNHNLVTGTNGNIILRKEDNSTTKIVFSELKELFDQIVSGALQKENTFSGIGIESQYLSEEKDSNGHRVWREFTLDQAQEGEIYKFQTDENVWSAKLDGYDPSQIDPITKVAKEDSIKTAIEKIENQLNNKSVGVLVKTPMIADKSIDPTIHFKNPEASGFVLLSGAHPKNWRIQMTSGIQFKGEISPSEIEGLSLNAVSGDYYIITSDGEASNTQWNQGDWIIFDGEKYLQINNSGKVLSFNGRKGEIQSCPGSNGCNPGEYDYDWSMIDKSNSKLSDFPEIPTPKPIFDDNRVLKLINGQWVLVDEKTGISGNSTVPTSSIADGAIKDQHLKDINMNQIKGTLTSGSLKNDLDLLLDSTGGEVSGNINLQNNNLLGISIINFGAGDKLNLGEVINLASSSAEKILLKQDKLTLTGTSNQILISKNNDHEVLDLTTESVVEGQKNLYFSEQRVREAFGLPSFDGAPYIELMDISYNGENADTIQSAFEKLYAKIQNANSPANNSLEINAIKDNSIPISALAPADREGQTIMFFNGEWVYRSIAGLSLRGELNLATTTPTKIGLQDGDYYVITGAGELDGINYQKNDWAVFSSDANGFTRISKKQGIQSFNGRIGVINPEPNDYTWDQIDKNSAFLKTFSENVEDYSGLTSSDNGKILKWNGSKWEALEDNKGINLQSLSISNFSKGAVRSISTSDISLVDFNHINGISDNFNDNLVNLSSNPITFKGQLNFEKNFKIENIGDVLDENGVKLFSFSDIETKCNNLNLSNFEKFTGESVIQDGKIKILNANKEFVVLNPDMLTGDVAGAFFNPSKIANLPLPDFSMDYPDFNIEVGVTTFSELFNKLAAKVNSFINKETPGAEAIGEYGTDITLDDSYNGKMILVDSSNVMISNSVSSDFEVTIKRVDPIGIDPRNLTISVSLEDGQIEGKAQFYLKDNFASITLKKIKDNTSATSEFVVLRRSGAVN